MPANHARKRSSNMEHRDACERLYTSNISIMDKVALNTGCIRKALLAADATFEDLQPVNGKLSAKGFNAVVIITAHALALGEGIAYDVAQDYVDNIEVGDPKFDELVKKTTDLLKKK